MACFSQGSELGPANQPPPVTKPTLNSVSGNWRLSRVLITSGDPIVQHEGVCSYIARKLYYRKAVNARALAAFDEALVRSNR